MNFRKVRWSVALIFMGAFVMPLGIGVSDLGAMGIQGSLQPGNPFPNDPNNPNNPPNNPNGPNPPGSNNPDKPNLPKKPKNPNNRKVPPKSPPSVPDNPNPPSGPNNPNPPSGPNNPNPPSGPNNPSPPSGPAPTAPSGPGGTGWWRNAIGYGFGARHPISTEKIAKCECVPCPETRRTARNEDSEAPCEGLAAVQDKTRYDRVWRGKLFA